MVLKRGLTAYEINEFLIGETNFIGCFPSDKIPKITKYPCSLIINSEKSTHPGSHWLSVFLDEEFSLYFDSFGLPVLENDIFYFLKENSCSKNVIFNKLCIQDIESVSCGLFCISFIKHVHSIKSFDTFLCTFSTHYLKSNDSKVLKLL